VDHDSPNRVTRGSEAAYLRDEALFLPRLHACALLAGVEPRSSEMALFSRWCFLRARQLDALGDSEPADQLLSLALYSGSADPARSAAWQQPLYQALRRLIGSRAIGSLSGLHRPSRPHIVPG